MGTTKQTFTGDKTNLEQAYKSLQADVVRLEQANQRLANQVDRASNSQNTQLSKSRSLLKDNIAEVGRLATGWLSAAAAVAAMNAELQKKHELESRAADTQRTVARSQAELFQGMAGATSAERQQAVAGVRRIALETKFPDEKALTGAVAAAYGVNGGNVKSALDAARLATGVTGVTPEDVDDVSAATALIMRTGNLSAEQASAFIATAGDVSPIKKLMLRSEHIPGAVTSMSGTVKTDRLQAMRESAALFAALSTETADFEGARSRTAGTSLTTQLEELFTTGMKMSVGGQNFKLKPGEDPGTIAGRIRYLQENQKYAKAYLASANMEQNYKIPIRELLTNPESTISKSFQEFIPKVNTDSTSFDALRRDLQGGTSELRLANAAQAAESNQQQLQLGQTAEGRAAEIRKILASSLESTAGYTQTPWGTRYLANKGAVINQDINSGLLPAISFGQFGGSPGESAIKMLQERQDEVRMRERSILFRTNLGDLTPIDKLNADERRDFEYLGKQIEAVRQLMEDQLQATQEMNNRDASREQRRPAATGVGAEVGRHRER